MNKESAENKTIKYTPNLYDLQEKSYKKILGPLGWFELSIIVAALSMVIMSFWHGITGDDIVVNEYGKEILKYIGSFGSYEYNYEHPLPKEYDRDMVIQYYGGLFSVICALFNKISPFEEYTTIHIFNALSGALAAFFAGRILKRYFSETAAVLVVWLMFLAPFWLGNAMNNPKDTPFAAAFIAAIYFIFRLMDRLPNVNWKDGLWPVIAIACAINVRVGGVLLIPYLFAFLIGAYLYNKIFTKENFPISKGILYASIISFCAYFGASLVWPSALQAPFEHPLESLKMLTNFPISIRQIWEGNKIDSASFPTSYLPKAIFITSPFLFLVGLIALTPISLLLYKNKKSFQFFILLCLLFAFAFPIAYIIYKKSNIYHLWRHSLFIFPIAAVLASFGWDYIANYFNKPTIKYAVIAIAILLSAEPLWFTLKTFPNTMSYFNSTVGGVKGAYGNYEVDFYFNSVKESVDWFKKNELSKVKKGDTITLATNAPHIVGQYFKNEPRVKTIYVKHHTNRHEVRYDYSLFHITLMNQGNVKSGLWASNALYKSQIEGKTMCAIQKKTNQLDVEGMELMKKNDPAGIAKLQAFLQTDPNNELVNGVLADAFILSDSFEKALPYINTCYNTDSFNADHIGAKAMYAARKGNTAIVNELINKSISIDETNLKPYLDLGSAYAASKNYDAALQNYNKAIADLRFAPSALFQMSKIYEQTGNLPAAQDYMNKAQQAQQQLQQAMGGQ
jgi:tetratricopeptide (TPR) repeat protein